VVSDLAPVASYLSAAEATLPAEHTWVAQMREIRENALAQISAPAKRSAAALRRPLATRLGELKQAYVQTYLTAHARARLGVDDDRRKRALARDDRLLRSWVRDRGVAPLQCCGGCSIVTARWRKSSRFNGLRTNAVVLAPRRQCRGRVRRPAAELPDRDLIDRFDPLPKFEQMTRLNHPRNRLIDCAVPLAFRSCDAKF
jgi:hypothetical protein